MKSKGLSNIFVRHLVFMVAVIIFFTLVFLYWRAELNSEKIIDDNEVEVTRKIVYARILLSSDLLAYEDENGVHKGMFDKRKLDDKDLTAKKLFSTYSYQGDDIEDADYFHYVRIESWNKKSTDKDYDKGKFEKIKEFSQIKPKHAIEFPVTIQYDENDVRLGKIIVDLIQSGNIAVDRIPTVII